MFLPVNPFARPGEFAHPPGGAVSYPSPHIAGPGPPLVLAPQFAAAGIAPLLDREPVDVCKLFVGGLSPSTTDADLEEHFKQFGRVKSAVVMIDKRLNRSRCFGFVTFSTEKEAIKAYAADSHNIGGNEVELRRAVPRTTLPPQSVWGLTGAPQAAGVLQGGRGLSGRGAGEAGRDTQPPEEPEDRDCKVFIGGIPSSMTTEDIKAFFTKRFGMVKRVDFFYDRVTGRMRGFGFLVFSFPHSAEMAVGHHQIGDVTIEVKKAVERAEMRSQKAAGGDTRQARQGRGYGGRQRVPPGTAHLGPSAMTPLLDFVPYEVAAVGAVGAVPPNAASAAAAAARPSGTAAALPGALQDPYSVASATASQTAYSQAGAAFGATTAALDASTAAAAAAVPTAAAAATPALAAFPQSAVYVQPGPAAFGYAVVPTAAAPDAYASASAAAAAAVAASAAAAAGEQGAPQPALPTPGADPYEVQGGGPVRSRGIPGKATAVSAIRAQPY